MTKAQLQARVEELEKENERLKQELDKRYNEETLRLCTAHEKNSHE